MSAPEVMRPCGHCREAMGRYLAKCGLAPAGTVLTNGTKSLHPIHYEIWLCADCILGLYEAGELAAVHATNLRVDASPETAATSRYLEGRNTGWKGKAHRTHNPGPGLRRHRNKNPNPTRRLFAVDRSPQ
jgi:hypothetical protein